MHPNSCILIHPWPVVQIGIRTVLQSLKIEVREIFSECPEYKTFADWSDIILLIDVKYQELIHRHHISLRKRGISIIGLDFQGEQIVDVGSFEEVLLQSDNQSQLFFKLNKFVRQGNRENSTSQLSVRETEVLKLVALGQSNKQISQKLFISIHTVISHRKNITSKLGIKSISGLTLYAAINNLID